MQNLSWKSGSPDQKYIALIDKECIFMEMGSNAHFEKFQKIHDFSMTVATLNKIF